MMGTLALACFGTGFAAGWLLRTIFVMAEISWSQERMQRKVFYWQCEAAHARAIADELAWRLAASTGSAHKPQDWPSAESS